MLLRQQKAVEAAGPPRPGWAATIATVACRSAAVLLVFLGILHGCSAGPGPGDSGRAAPHIVILLADDLGWTDVSFHGGNIATPNIDRIAAEGAELRRFYVAPVCSPTRAGLMTGRYPIRYGAMRAVYPPWRRGGMDTSEWTMADILADAGYRHRAVFGKWHLGHSDKKFHPLRRGFTQFYGHFNGAIDYFTHEREGEVDWHDGFEPSADVGYQTDLVADAATRFIREHAADPEPFLCYVAFNAPHSPFQAKPEDLPRYEHLPPARGFFQALDGVDMSASREARARQRRILGAMVHSLDQGIGRILAAIDEERISRETFVLFASDNGGVRGVGENVPLRGAKATVFEGGIRVAAAARWVGKIPPGRRIDVPLANIDVLPTLMRLARSERYTGKPLDGIDILDVLTGRQEQLDRELYNYIGQEGADKEQISVMTNEWKMIVIGPDVRDSSVPESSRRRFLFRIDEDLAEERNVVGQHPDLAASMYRKILDFRALQPADAVRPYSEGRHDSGFKAPARWQMAGE